MNLHPFSGGGEAIAPSQAESWFDEPSQSGVDFGTILTEAIAWLTVPVMPARARPAHP
ncbi:MAG: hypothetical protein WBA43_01365 [Elainellaceae cyanobacterium]